jgi:hypothetical protein
MYFVLDLVKSNPKRKPKKNAVINPKNINPKISIEISLI